MSQEELALETQLLLQEVTQAKRLEDAVIEGDDGAPVSEYEEAKQALLQKLRRKKEANRQKMRQLNQQRYGVSGVENEKPQEQTMNQRQTPSFVSPTKMKLPVAAQTGVATRKKKDLLSKLRKQAIQQGSQEMAKLFGYASYEEQLKHLNKLEKLKILQNEMKEKQQQDAKTQQAQQENDKDEPQNEEVVVVDVDDVDMATEENDPTTSVQEPETEDFSVATSQEQKSELKESDAVDVTESPSTTTQEIHENHEQDDKEEEEEEVVAAPARKRLIKNRNQIRLDDDEDDGNEADSEQDDGVEEDNDDADDKQEQETTGTQQKKKDKAEAFRRLLQAEVMQQKKRKRLIKHADFVESEAEEEEEEDVLKIGGLGDFGFGVPQPTTAESKEAEEERNALKLREDDLEGIVDDLSDDEKNEQVDLDEIIRQEDMDDDRQQVKEVMRHVKEGFGRNRRAFSGGLHMGAEARGRFNLNELVAADGKLEAARLGLLESDEELSDNDSKTNDKKHENEEEQEEEDDEEAAMERALRERFQNQPKIYITSSESEDEADEGKDDDQANQPDANEMESDEEREKQQMKLFSERARINRRIRRMKEMQRLEEETEEPTTEVSNTSTAVTAPSLPSILLEEDEESQELVKLLHRTDAPAAKEHSTTAIKKKPAGAALRPKLGRFNSFTSTSSFSRVVQNVKLFGANATGNGASSGKGFVFTSAFASHGRQDDDDLEEETTATFSQTTANNQKNKRLSSASQAPSQPNKLKRRKSDFFSVLASYQCHPQTHSAPM